MLVLANKEEEKLACCARNDAQQLGSHGHLVPAAVIPYEASVPGERGRKQPREGAKMKNKHRKIIKSVVVVVASNNAQTRTKQSKSSSYLTEKQTLFNWLSVGWG